MTHKKPLTLALVIPVYNEEIYLPQCLNSINAQTIKPLQVIIVDNNSTDRSLEVVKKYPFVTVIKEQRQGVAFARSAGFNVVNADIIGRIDADTILPADWCERVIDILSCQPEVAGLSGPTGFYDLPFSRIALLITHLIRWTLFWGAPKGRRYLFGSNMAIRRAAWEVVKNELCINHGIHEDTDLSLHLEKAGYRIIYSSRLSAMISGRRADATLIQAYSYAFMQKKTFKNHSIRFHGAATGIVLFCLYPPVHWFRRFFNPQTRRFSWKYFRHTKLKPRPLPMD